MPKVTSIQKYRALRQLKVLREDVAAGMDVSSVRFAETLEGLHNLRVKRKGPTPHEDLPFGERRQRDRAMTLGFGMDYFTMRRYRAERDKEIISQLDEGRAFVSVAKEHWLSTRRVAAIWHQIKCVENFNERFMAKVKNYRGIYSLLREKGYTLSEAYDVIKDCTPKKPSPKKKVEK